MLIRNDSNVFDPHFTSMLNAMHYVRAQVLDALNMVARMMPFAAEDILNMVNALMTEMDSFCLSEHRPKIKEFNRLFRSLGDVMSRYMSHKWLPSIRDAHMDKRKAKQSMCVIMFWDRVVRVTTKAAKTERSVSRVSLCNALRVASGV